MKVSKKYKFSNSGKLFRSYILRNMLRELNFYIGFILKQKQSEFSFFRNKLDLSLQIKRTDRRIKLDQLGC